ncbi:MAG: tyrosine-type recombinase/integrase [Candidatus Magasanikbacteria bacterium]|nr:tyrosine-type recombinase/integrase [Candidatus Magasanikbacteria bacterium]
MEKRLKEPLPQLDSFLLYLQTNNYSEKTVYNYERDLTVFETFLAGVPVPFSQVDKGIINQYKAYLNSIDRHTAKEHAAGDTKLTSFSVNRHLSALRSYLRYLIEMDFNPPIPPEVIKLVKQERKHPRVPELNELVRLIESPSTFEKNKTIAARNRTMLEMLFSTGMRISELIGLNRQQIDDSGRIFIRGKGKKERFVYLTPRAYHHLKNYLHMRTDSSDALFIPYRGRNVTDETKNKKRISPNYLQDRIKRYREMLHINVPISAHTLRHGFATYLAEQGANPAAIQILLGHESLDTTTRYVHASDRYAEKTHTDFHPLKGDN